MKQGIIPCGGVHEVLEFEEKPSDDGNGLGRGGRWGLMA